MKRLVPEAGLSYNSNSFSCQCAALVLKKTVYCLSHVTLITYVRTAQKKLGTLERMFHLPSRTLGDIYFKTVLPQITYRISVQGGCTTPLFNKLEEIHAKAARYIHRIHCAAGNFKVLKQTNCHPF